MINEAEKSNVSAAIFKFVAVSLIIVGVGSFMVHYVHCLQLALKAFEIRLEQLL